ARKIAPARLKGGYRQARTDCRSTHLEDELAPEVARLAQSMGIACFGQPVELDLGRPHSSRLNEVDDAFEMPPRPPNRRSQRLDVIAWRFRRLRPGGDKGGPTARPEHREGALRHVAPDRIEDGIAIGRNFSEIDRVVVDDFIRSEAAHIIMI